MRLGLGVVLALRPATSSRTDRFRCRSATHQPRDAAWPRTRPDRGRSQPAAASQRLPPTARSAPTGTRPSSDAAEPFQCKPGCRTAADDPASPAQEGNPQTGQHLFSDACIFRRKKKTENLAKTTRGLPDFGWIARDDRPPPYRWFWRQFRGLTGLVRGRSGLRRNRSADDCSFTVVGMSRKS